MKASHDCRTCRWPACVGLLLLSGALGLPRAKAEDSVVPRPKTLQADRSFDALFGPNQSYRYFENAEHFPFQWNAKQFNRTNLWWLAEASMLVYVDDRSFVLDQFRKAGLNQVQIFSSPEESAHDTQGLIAANERFAIVAMRGTEPNELKDFLTDLNLLQKEIKNRGQVHVGFKSALDDVWGDMKSSVDRLASEGRTIWFTGHSLGAALAVLAADQFGKANGVYTFGSPRVGDEGFRSHYRQPTYRVVHNTDLVTELPPPMFYRHVGALKYFGSDQRLAEGAAATELLQDRLKGQMQSVLTTLGSWKEGRFNLNPPKNISDHAPIDYVTLSWNHLIEEVR